MSNVSNALTLRASATEPISFQLVQTDPTNGVQSNSVITNASAIEWHLQNLSTLAVTTAMTLANGKITITDGPNGKIQVSPSGSDIVFGTYNTRFQVVDSVGRTASFPSDSELRLNVLTAY